MLTKKYHYDGLPTDKKLFNTELRTVSAANPTRPDNDTISIAGSLGYDRIQVYKSFRRISPALTVVNFGAGDLYLIYSINGEDFSEHEIFIPAPVLPDKYNWVLIRNVWEARVRSPNATTQYLALEGYFK